MKKTLLTILALIVIVPAIIAKHKKQHKASGREIVSVTMRHGGCFGRCPQYTIDINKSGMVTYTGIRFTKDSGMFEKNVGITKVKTLFDRFNSYRVDTCSAIYTNRIPDVSGTYYTIVYKDITKTIGNAGFGPDFLKELTNDVNNMGVVDDSWKKVVGK